VQSGYARHLLGRIKADEANSVDNEHPLLDILEREEAELKKFASNRPDLWQIIHACGTTAEALLAPIWTLGNTSAAEELRLMLWQKVVDYQFLSLKFIITRELDAGYTLLRNVAELVRDIACIKNNPDHCKLWYASKFGDKQDRKKYRDTFKFDTSDSRQKSVYELYQRASEWGTHGHYSILLFSERAATIDKKDLGLGVRISDQAVYDELVVWFASFCSIQWLCSEELAKSHAEDFEFSWESLVKFEGLMANLLPQLKAGMSDHVSD
jgi:hypothetical protein